MMAELQKQTENDNFWLTLSSRIHNSQRGAIEEPSMARVLNQEATSTSTAAFAVQDDG